MQGGVKFGETAVATGRQPGHGPEGGVCGLEVLIFSASPRSQSAQQPPPAHPHSRQTCVAPPPVYRCAPCAPLPIFYFKARRVPFSPPRRPMPLPHLSSHHLSSLSLCFIRYFFWIGRSFARSPSILSPFSIFVLDAFSLSLSLSPSPTFRKS